jgi:hypothetical protein
VILPQAHIFSGNSAAIAEIRAAKRKSFVPVLRSAMAAPTDRIIAATARIYGHTVAIRHEKPLDNAKDGYMGRGLFKAPCHLPCARLYTERSQDPLSELFNEVLPLFQSRSPGGRCFCCSPVALRGRREDG